MLSEAEFKRAIELGLIAEEIVLLYLQSNNSLVQDMRKQMHEYRKGPRLKGTEGEIILPDFAVYNKNPSKGKFAVDAKYKNSLYPVNGKQCFTVDNKLEDYRRATQILGLEFLVIAFMYKNKLYFYKDTEYCEITTFNNQHGTGSVYCFEFDESKHTY